MSQSEEISHPSGNWLLDALPREDYERIAPDLKPVTAAATGRERPGDTKQ